MAALSIHPCFDFAQHERHGRGAPGHPVPFALSEVEGRAATAALAAKVVLRRRHER